MGNDMLSATLLVATCPVVYVPAMHTEMWLNPATQDNVETLRDRAGDARSDAETRVEEGRARLTKLQEDLPSQFDELRDKLTSEELRKLADSYVEFATTGWTSLANVTGWAAISLPLGRTADGLPIGVQLMAPVPALKLLTCRLVGGKLS